MPIHEFLQFPRSRGVSFEEVGQSWFDPIDLVSKFLAMTYVTSGALTWCPVQLWSFASAPSNFIEERHSFEYPSRMS